MWTMATYRQNRRRRVLSEPLEFSKLAPPLYARTRYIEGQLQPHRNRRAAKKAAPRPSPAIAQIYHG